MAAASWYAVMASPCRRTSRKALPRLVSALASLRQPPDRVQGHKVTAQNEPTGCAGLGAVGANAAVADLVDVARAGART